MVGKTKGWITNGSSVTSGFQALSETMTNTDWDESLNSCKPIQLHSYNCVLLKNRSGDTISCMVQDESDQRAVVHGYYCTSSWVPTNWSWDRDTLKDLLTLGAHAHSEGYCSCRVCMYVCVYVCVTTHNCRLTHWNHTTVIPMGSQQYSDRFKFCRFS